MFVEKIIHFLFAVGYNRIQHLPVLTVGRPQLLGAQLSLQQANTVVMSNDASYGGPHPWLTGNKIEFLVKGIVQLKIARNIAAFQPFLLLQQIGTQAAHGRAVGLAHCFAENGALGVVA